MSNILSQSNSILSQYELSIETFEAAIAVGRTPSQILLMFNTTTRKIIIKKIYR